MRSTTVDSALSSSSMQRARSAADLIDVMLHASFRVLSPFRSLLQDRVSKVAQLFLIPFSHCERRPVLLIELVLKLSDAFAACFHLSIEFRRPGIVLLEFLCLFRVQDVLVRRA